jgi:rhomboid protease GluP
MALRQRTGSTVCPGCGTLVGVNDEVCYSCGRRNPALWGFSPLLRRLGQDLGFTNLVTLACVGLYLATLVASPQGPMGGGVGLGLLSPDTVALLLFGASGFGPIYFGHWWSILSAGWLHGGLLHIGLNMYSFRQLAPATAEIYGPARTVIVYVVGGACGFALTSFMAYALPRVPLLHGSVITIGASAPIFGMIGALYYYGRSSGSSLIRQYIASNAIIWILWGLMMPGIDNWAHAGGFLGGYVAGRLVNPHQRERVDHMLVALALLVASALAIVASVVLGVPPALLHLLGLG